MNLLKTAVAACIALCISSVWAQNSKAKVFHVFLPQSEYWIASVPMINEDGKSRKLDVDPEHCGWYYRRYVNETIPQKVLVHREEDATMDEAIGVNGYWETNFDSPAPIPMNSMFELYENNDDIYFVVDEDKVIELGYSSNKGWYTERPPIEGLCRFDIPFLIYDTDASLHGAFTCAPEWNAAQTPAEARVNDCYYANAKYQVVRSSSDEVPCIGVTQGMVNSVLSVDPVSKRRLMTLTDKGRKCFGSQADSAFSAMFKQADGVNQESCFDVPITRTADGEWSFESDSYVSPGVKTPVKGGFYPAEQTSDAMMLSERLAAAETKRDAQGPAFYGPKLRKLDSATHAPILDLVCNGPGWDKGYDCNGQFADGETAEFVKTALKLDKNDCVFGWECDYESAAPEGWPVFAVGTETPSSPSEGNKATYRWTSKVGESGNGGRNQHFCAETHANFRYRKGLNFAIRGNDDIWVFIDRKLAIDLGGVHLAAPGFVDLDKFMPDADVGASYDIDIYTCQRRTTASSLNIKTNMFFGSSEPYRTGILIRSNTNKEAYRTYGDNHYNVCTFEDGFNCFFAINGRKEVCEETDVRDPVHYVSYLLSTDKYGDDSTKTIVSEAVFEANPVQFGGAINVTDKRNPIVNKDKLKGYLSDGTYYLIVKNKSGGVSLPIVVGDESSIPATRSNVASSNSFRVQVAAPLELSIAMDNATAGNAAQYAIMDMKGQVLAVGLMNNSETRVKVPTAGFYIVKVGQRYKRVNVK